MKSTINFLVLISGLVLLANAANAETPRDELKQIRTLLQGSGCFWQGLNEQAWGGSCLPPYDEHAQPE